MRAGGNTLGSTLIDLERLSGRSVATAIKTIIDPPAQVPLPSCYAYPSTQLSK